MEKEELLTLVQAAEYCGYRAATISIAIRKGKVKARKFGHTWAVTRTAVDDWLKTGLHKGGRPRKNA